MAKVHQLPVRASERRGKSEDPQKEKNERAQMGITWYTV